MKRTVLAAGAGMLMGVAATTGFQNLSASHQDQQPYATEQGRMISSLSQKDVEELKAGNGWGLAKPAEFNGYPGPSHVLEFAGKLDLTDEQNALVQKTFDEMKVKARELGKALVEAEAALDLAFKSKAITPKILNERLATAETLRKSLRAVHLSAHLEITPLLTSGQKQLYASLRGYDNGHNSHEGH